MATFCYRIRSTQKNKLVKVQILFTVGRGNQFYVDSQYLILTDAWDSKRQSIKSRYTFTDDFTEQQGRELTKNLSELRSFILGEMAKDPEHAMTKTKLEKIVYSFHHPRSASGGHDIRSRESLTDYMARYTREMEAGTRLNIHKLRYGASTIKNYKGFIIQFDEFCKAKRKRFDFGDIDLKFYDDFVAWFTTKDYSINTIGRHVKELKIIMRAAREEGLHDIGLIESRKFRVLTVMSRISILPNRKSVLLPTSTYRTTNTKILPAIYSWSVAIRHSDSATTRPSTRAISARWKVGSGSLTSNSRRQAITSSSPFGPNCRRYWTSTKTGCRKPTNRK